MITEFKKDSKDDPFSKPRYDLVDAVAFREFVNVLTDGARKYGEYNWQQANRQQIRHYYGAIFRHLEAIRMGELVDPESKRLHAAHLACNAHFLTFFTGRKGWY